MDQTKADANAQTRDPWIVSGASARGSRHTALGLVNEDAFAATSDEEGARFVIAVADGHGAAVHHRSAIGAGFAANLAAAALGGWLDGDLGPAEALPAMVLNAWRTTVEGHVRRHSLPPGRFGRTSDPLIPYGSTLIAAAGDARRLILLQIGDGDALLGFSDGRIERPLADDAGLAGQQTYSLCQPDALGRFRLHVREARRGVSWPDFVSVSTDGVGKSFPGSSELMAGVGLLRDLAKADPARTTAGLPEWLEGMATGPTQDDATLCFALRDAAASA